MFRTLKKLYSQLSLVICFQMVFAPFAMAMDDRRDRSSDTGYSFWGDAAFMFSSAVNQFSQAYTQGVGANNNQYQSHYQNLNNILGLQPMQPGTGQFPAVFDGCMILPARGNQLGANAKCTAASHEEVLSGYAQAMIDVADENINKLENFTTVGANRTDARGVTCYNEAITGLAGQLKQREEQIDAYEQRLQNIFDQFELDSRETLAKIKQNDQILNGPCQECNENNGTPKVDYLRDYRFDQELLGAQDKGICGSWLTQAGLNSDGRQGGFRAIQNKFVTQEQQAEVFNGQRKQVKKEIESISRLLAGRYQQRRGLSLDNATQGFTTNSKFITPNSNAMKGALDRIQTKISDQLAGIEDTLAITGKVSGLSGEFQAAEGILNAVRSDSLTPEQIGVRLQQFERGAKSVCLNRLITSNFGSAQKLLGRFRNPNVSQAKNRDADNALANTLSADLGNLDQMDLDDFLARVKTEEAKGLNNRKILTLGKTFNFDGRTINASTPLRPSQLFGIFVKNCEDIYSKEPRGSGHSAKDIVDSIRDYAAKRQKLKQNFAGIIARDLKNDLLNCPQDTTTGTGANSCNANSISPGDANFCFRTAQKCASNVSACKNKIESKMKKIEADQEAEVAKYKAQVDQAKQALLAEVSAVQGFMVSEAQKLDAILNVGTLTGLPELNIDLKGDFIRRDVRTDLALEDPQKYLSQVKQQLGSLKQSMQQQRIELVGQNGDDPSNTSLSGKGRLGRMAAQYQQNYEQSKQMYGEIIADCNQAIGNAQQVEKQRNDAIAEQNKEITDACAGFHALSADPFSGDIGQVATDAARAVQVAASMPPTGQYINTRQDMRTIENIRRLNSSCSDENSRRRGRRGGSLTASKLCEMEASGSRPRVENRQGEQAAWDFFIGENETRDREIANLCQQAGLRGQGESNDIRICSNRNNRYLKKGVILCRSTADNAIDGTTQVEVSDLQTNGTPRNIPLTTLKTKGVLVTAETCLTASLPAIIKIDGEDKPLNWIEHTPTATEAESLVDGNPSLAKAAIYCLPDDQGAYGNTSEDAEEKLQDMIAAYDCINGSRTAGQRGLTICGGDMNGTSDKAIYGQMANDLAGAAGQAMAVGR